MLLCLLLSLHIGESGLLVVIGTDEAFVIECLVAIMVGLLVVEVALCALEHGLCATEFAHEVGSVQFGYYLTCLHFTIVVNIEFADDTTHLCTHIHAGDGFYGTCGCHTGDDVLFGGFGFAVCESFLLGTCCHDECGEEHDECLGSLDGICFHTSYVSLLLTVFDETECRYLCHRSIFSPV